MGQVEQVPSILAGVGRHAADGALIEEGVGIIERRNLAHVDAGQGQGSASVQRCQGRGD